jgi:hypothetical protein
LGAAIWTGGSTFGIVRAYLKRFDD